MLHLFVIKTREIDSPYAPFLLPRGENGIRYPPGL